MTTAREQLAAQLHELLKGAPTPEGTNKLNDLLKDFRVQAKAGTEVQPGVTAREALGKAIMAIWRRGPKDLERSVDALLDKYRMQVKKEGPSSPREKDEEETPVAAPVAKPAAAKPAVVPVAARPAAPAPAARPAVAAAAKPAAPPVPMGTRPPSVTPVAAPAARKPVTLPPARPGGSLPPQIAPRAAPQSVAPLFPNTPLSPSRRSECPKCKSRGVVLARTYAQEEYYSCIYCGWQAFKPFEEANADAPLAARLLSQRPALPKKKGLEDEDEPRKRSLIEPDEDDLPARATPAVRPDDSLEEDEERSRRSVIVEDAEEEEEDDSALDRLDGAEED
ncbi:MAG: hypothetical protein AB2A00_16580 [Myxococcota bacterium]